MDSMLAESLLPLKYAAFSHCFRTEAGAAGTALSSVHLNNASTKSFDHKSSTECNCPNNNTVA